MLARRPGDPGDVPPLGQILRLEEQSLLHPQASQLHQQPLHPAGGEMDKPGKRWGRHLSSEVRSSPLTSSPNIESGERLLMALDSKGS